jgi:uncharacterized protein YkwD
VKRPKFLRTGATAGAILVLAAAAQPAQAKKPACANANLKPSSTNLAKVQRATRCLINVQRKRHHLKALKYNADLQKSSDWQGQDMLTYAYFAHDRDGGPEFGERILRFGYAKGANGYTLGENIAWASVAIATPRRIVNLWMHSPGHRKNILTRGYEDQAISTIYSPGGVGGDYAQSNGPFVIYVNQFGSTS